MRVEYDSMGSVEVADDCYWGAQTQRSLQHFLSGNVWPVEVIAAFGLLKRCCAVANSDLGWLKPELSNAIVQAADEVYSGILNDHFPLRVFQTGSGTHSNMNANEVIANRANEILGQPLGSNAPVHPNDHVNMGQSSNDVFPTVMHLAVVDQLHNKLFPALRSLRDCLHDKSEHWRTLVKTGRTHLQDAAPLTLGQEVSGWVAQLDFVLQTLQQHLNYLLPLAIGGTAVGTGLNSHAQFSERVCHLLAELSKINFVPCENRFAALSSHEPLVELSAALRSAAAALMKIANDVRWLGSGPNCGLGELILPANEPGSSIMPGKVNPTQCESLTQVCVQLYGNDAAVAFAGSQGNFELNVYKPVMLHNVLNSIHLLSEAIPAFEHYCAAGLEANTENIQHDLQRNPMLVTALNQHIGYDKAAQIVKCSLQDKITLKQAAKQLGYVSEADFEQWVQPLAMTRQS